MEQISLVIPKPPSTNSLYANVPGRGRVRTRAYKDWITAAGWEIKLQAGNQQLKGKYVLSIWLPEGVDIDNGVKSIADLLGPPRGKKKHGLSITEDDREMVSLHVYRRPGKECKVMIEAGQEIKKDDRVS